MNNVPNESRKVMLSCTKISFVISSFDLEKFGIKPVFFFLTHTVWNNFILPTVILRSKMNVITTCIIDLFKSIFHFLTTQQDNHGLLITRKRHSSI